MMKKGNNSKMGNQIYFKIAGQVDLDMLHIVAINLTSISKQVLKYKTKSIKMLKKGNNSKMGNQMYFKIAGQVDLDMLNMFAVSTYHLSLIVFEIKDEKYYNFDEKREITPK